MSFVVSMLGEAVIRVHGVEVAITSRKQRALLAALAMQRGTPRSIELLVEDLWGRVAPATAHKNVQVLVGRVRALVGSADAIRHGDGGYRLERTYWEFEDEVFQDELRSAHHLASNERWLEVIETLDGALDRWRGDALGSLAGDFWASTYAREIDDDRRTAVILHNGARVYAGLHERAVIDLTAASVRYPRDLDVLGLQVRALHRAGRQAEALDCCRTGLALARKAAVTSEVDRFRSLERDVLRQIDQFAIRREPILPRVPVPRHDMVGREREVEIIRTGMSDGSRWTTIVGPGGTGKTRLATAAATSFEGDVDDVVWIDLSPSLTVDDVLTTLLNAFGITSVGGDPIDALTQAIGARSIVMVLDNFEQVIASADVVARLRDECEHLRLLVTSRVALGHEAEDVVQLAPFELADDDMVDPEVLCRLDAVRLFLDRASLVDGIGASDRSRSNIRDVHSICARVDGLPLGIELAAARTLLLPPREILAQVDRTGSLLTTRAPEQPERHRSLDSVIEWSYQLLDDEERRSFQALSLFVGGCTPTDFSFVAQLPDEAAATRVLERLARNSLATGPATEDDPLRWRMLKTIATFGRERLREDPTGHEVRRRFVECMRGHAHASNTYGALESGAEQRLIVERANVHAAFDCAVDESVEAAADIFIAMDRYLHTRGSMHEGDDLGKRLHPLVDQLDVRRRSLVLGLIGRMAHYAGDETRSHELLTSGIELAREHALDEVEMRIRIWHVERQRMSGLFEEPVEQADAARVIAERVDDPWHVALALAQIGFAHVDHEAPEEATRCFSRALEIFDELGDRYWSLNMMVNLASVALVQTGDERQLDRLKDIESELARLQYWTYAAHTGTAVLRSELEMGRFHEAATCADLLLPRVRRTGETVMLMFALACASVAYLEVGRQSEAREAAWESLLQAARMKVLLYVDYSLVALACSIDDRELARWLAEFIDMQYLDGIFALDRHLISELALRVGKVEHRPIPSGGERIGAIRDVIVRLRDSSAVDRS